MFLGVPFLNLFLSDKSGLGMPILDNAVFGFGFPLL
jgi:hypothetical protein